MFSMAHHKCQVTVLLHDRVMVTTFKLKIKEEKSMLTKNKKKRGKSCAVLRCGL